MTPDASTNDRGASKNALIVVGGLITVKLALHAYANTVGHYEFHRDEFLYFAMGEHLRLFGMDFPPFIAILSETVRGLFGDSLLGVRAVPALTGCGLMIVAALSAREIGGGTFAQGLAALAVLCSTLFLRASNLFQPVIFDQFWWSLAMFFLIKLAVSKNPKWWLAYGVAVGLGLLTKFSILIFGFATFIAILATPEREWLKTRWPWLASLVAVLIGSPSIIGQIALGWPVFGQMEAIGIQFEQVSYLGFILEQPKMHGGFVLGLVGAGALVSRRLGPRLQIVGVTAILAFLTLMLSHGKGYYIGPIYPVLFGAGAVVFERIRHRVAGPVIRWGTVGTIVAYAAILLPLGIPILKPVNMESYLVKFGLQKAATTNIGNQERIPQDYADMINWRQKTEAVARVYHQLPPTDQRKTVILAANYGQAGAIDFYGPALGIPRAVAVVGTYWYFGPGELPGEVMVSIGVAPEDLAPYYESVVSASTATHPYAVSEERNVPILVARRPKHTLQEIWPAFEGRH